MFSILRILCRTHQPFYKGRTHIWNGSAEPCRHCLFCVCSCNLSAGAFYPSMANKNKRIMQLVSPLTDRTLHLRRMRSCLLLDVPKPFHIFAIPACTSNRFIMKYAASCQSVHVDSLTSLRACDTIHVAQMLSILDLAVKPLCQWALILVGSADNKVRKLLV